MSHSTETFGKQFRTEKNRQKTRFLLFFKNNCLQFCFKLYKHLVSERIYNYFQGPLSFFCQNQIPFENLTFIESVIVCIISMKTSDYLNFRTKFHL